MFFIFDFAYYMQNLENFNSSLKIFTKRIKILKKLYEKFYVSANFDFNFFTKIFETSF